MPKLYQQFEVRVKKLNNFSLKGFVFIYTTCEPCPMCLSAIYWSRIDKMCIMPTQEVMLQKIDFDDSLIYEELNKSILRREKFLCIK